VQSFMVKQCMTLMATRHRAATDNVHLHRRAIFAMKVALTVTKPRPAPGRAIHASLPSIRIRPHLDC
jgi:hypothetical protein